MSLLENPTITYKDLPERPSVEIDEKTKGTKKEKEKIYETTRDFQLAQLQEIRRLADEADLETPFDDEYVELFTEIHEQIKSSQESVEVEGYEEGSLPSVEMPYIHIKGNDDPDSETLFIMGGGLAGKYAFQALGAAMGALKDKDGNRRNIVLVPNPLNHEVKKDMGGKSPNGNQLKFWRAVRKHDKLQPLFAEGLYLFQTVKALRSQGIINERVNFLGLSNGAPIMARALERIADDNERIEEEYQTALAETPEEEKEKTVKVEDFVMLAPMGIKPKGWPPKLLRALDVAVSFLVVAYYAYRDKNEWMMEMKDVGPDSPHGWVDYWALIMSAWRGSTSALYDAHQSKSLPPNLGLFFWEGDRVAPPKMGLRAARQIENANRKTDITIYKKGGHAALLQRIFAFTLELAEREERLREEALAS